MNKHSDMKLARMFLLVAAVAIGIKGVGVMALFGIVGSIVSLPYAWSAPVLFGILLGVGLMALGFAVYNLTKLSDGELIKRKEKILLLAALLILTGTGVTTLISMVSLGVVSFILYEASGGLSEDKKAGTEEGTVKTEDEVSKTFTDYFNGKSSNDEATSESEVEEPSEGEEHSDDESLPSITEAFDLLANGALTKEEFDVIKEANLRKLQK